MVENDKAVGVIQAHNFESISFFFFFFKFFTDNASPYCLYQGGVLPHAIPLGMDNSFLEEMKEIENHHFANPNQITDSGNNYEWMKL